MEEQSERDATLLALKVEEEGTGAKVRAASGRWEGKGADFPREPLGGTQLC